MSLTTAHTHRGQGCEAFVIDAFEDGPSNIGPRSFIVHDPARTRAVALEVASQGLVVDTRRIVGTNVVRGEDGFVNELNADAADALALARPMLKEIA